MRGWKWRHHLRASQSITAVYSCAKSSSGVRWVYTLCRVWPSTGAPVHSRLLSGCSPFTLHPITTTLWSRTWILYGYIAHRPEPSQSRKAAVWQTHRHFCCDLHRVACHHKARADATSTSPKRLFHIDSERLTFKQITFFFSQHKTHSSLVETELLQSNYLSVWSCKTPPSCFQSHSNKPEVETWFLEGGFSLLRQTRIRHTHIWQMHITHNTSCTLCTCDIFSKIPCNEVITAFSSIRLLCPYYTFFFHY